MKLRVLAAHQDHPYPEVGAVTGAFWNAERTRLVIASVHSPAPSRVRPYFSFPHAARVSIYDTASRELLGALAPAPANDVAFHPTQPIALICSGGYDGGYSFNGTVVLWNWERQEQRTLAVGPAFYRARFDDADRFTILCSPRNDEEVEAGEEAYNIFRTTTFRLDEVPEGGWGYDRFDPALLRTVKPDSVGLEILLHPDRLLASRREVADFLGQDTNLGSIMDIVSQGGRLVTVRDRPALEWRASSGHRLGSVESDLAGAQVFVLDAERVLISLYGEKNFAQPSPEIVPRGRLVVATPDAREFSTLIEGPNPFLVSSRADGAIFARSCGHYSPMTSSTYCDAPGVDYIAHRLQFRPLPSLGSYEGFAHCLSSRGSQRFYFLTRVLPKDWSTPVPGFEIWTQGDQAASFLDFVDKRAEIDPKKVPYLHHGAVCVYPTESDEEDLIGSARLWSANPENFIWRHSLSGKHWRWQSLMRAPVHLLLALPAHGAILAASDEGTVTLLDAETGAVRDELHLTHAGIPSPAVAACRQDDDIVLATLEGRIVRLRID